MEERYTDYKLEKSRNGLTVPVINGIYLHSVYNPVKEAYSFAKLHEDSLRANSNILILGLGFGYHVEEIAKILNEAHSSSKIVILEPNRTLAEDFVRLRNFEDQSIEILSTHDIETLFSDLEFSNFLMSKPALIKHDSSFAIDTDFYRSFLSYNAPKKIADYQHILSELSSTLFSPYKDFSVSHASSGIASHGVMNDKRDFLLLAFNEVTKTAHKGKL